MEVFLDPNKDLSTDEPIILTQFNLSKAIKDSILTNLGECGLASSQNSFQGEIMQFNDLTLYILFRFFWSVHNILLWQWEWCGIMHDQSLRWFVYVL